MGAKDAVTRGINERFRLEQSGRLVTARINIDGELETEQQWMRANYTHAMAGQTFELNRVCHAGITGNTSPYRCQRQPVKLSESAFTSW